MKSNRMEFNRISSNLFDRTESNFFNISMFLWELIKIIQMHQIHHVKSFKCNKTDRTELEKTSKYWKSSDPANPCFGMNLMRTRNSIRLILYRFDWVRFDSIDFVSIRFDSISIWYALNSRVSLYNMNWLKIF